MAILLPVEPEILDHAQTPIGTLYLERCEGAPGEDWFYQIQIDGELLMSSFNPVSEIRLSTSALSMHEGKGPLRVLIGGLGLGYTADAALDNERVSSVRVVEAMDFVIRWMNKGLLPLSERLTRNESVDIAQGDVFGDLLGPATETYDLILVDVDHAPDATLSPDSAPFYTADGQKGVAAHLNPGGVLGVWSAWDNADFAAVLSEAYPESHRETVRWVNEGHEPFCNVLFFAKAGQAP